MAVSNQEVAAYLAANPDLSDAQIAQAAAAAGVSPQQLAQVTNLPVNEVIARVAATVEPNNTINMGGTVIQPVYSSTGEGENFQQGGISEILTYKAGQSTGDSYTKYTPTGQSTGAGQFQDVQNLGDMLQQDLTTLSPVIIAALTGGGASGLLGGAINSGLGLGLGTAGTSALGGATLGGLTSAVTGQDILKGALLGGAGGYLSGSGMFGGSGAEGMTAAEQLAAADLLGGADVAGGLSAADAAAAGLGGGFTNISSALSSLGLTADQIAAIEGLGGADVAGGLTADAATTAGLGGGFNLSGLTADQLAVIDALGGADVAGGLTTDAATTAGLGGGFTGVTTGLGGLTAEQLDVINGLGGADVAGGLTTTDAATAGLGGGITGVTTGGTTGVTTDVTTGGTTGGTTGVTTGGLTGLTTDQIITLIKSGVTLTGLLGAGKVITGGSGGGGGGTNTTFVPPTQGIPQNNPAYYNQLQQYYNGYLPQSPRDVVSPLQQWYNSSYGA